MHPDDSGRQPAVVFEVRTWAGGEEMERAVTRGEKGGDWNAKVLG